MGLPPGGLIRRNTACRLLPSQQAGNSNAEQATRKRAQPCVYTTHGDCPPQFGAPKK